jgi:hypothetical protein
VSKPVRFPAFLRGTGFEPTPAQRVMCSVLWDDVDPADLRGDDRELATSMFGPVDTVPASSRGVRVQVKGRGVGGTMLTAYRGVHLGLTVVAPRLAPGEPLYWLFVGPDLRLARQAMRFAWGLVEATPALRRRVVGEATRDSFTLRRDDGRIVILESLPATRGGSALRGRSLAGAHLTEFAFFRGEDAAINDVEVLRAVAARIIAGGEIDVESTVWTEAGQLFEFDRSDWGNPTGALVARCPTLTMRPDAHTRAIVEAERVRDPENAAREFDAVFLGGGASAFFDAHSLERAVNKARALVLRMPGAVIGAAADLGLVSDSSAIAIVALIDGRFVLLELLEIRPRKGAPLRLSEVIAAFAAVMRAHGVTEFYADSHAREPAREWCDKEGIRLVGGPEGNAGKVSTYQALQSVFREGRMELPRHDRLLAQIRGIVSKPTAGGLLQISSPRRSGSGHGDLVSALVLAVFAASIAQADNARQPPPGTGPSYTFENTPLGHFGINETNPFNF